MKSIHKQRGLGYIGWLFVIAGISLAAILGLKIIPPYAQNATIVGIIESVKDEPDISKKSRRAIRSMIEKRFDINMISGVSSKDVKITKKDGTVTATLDYQIQEPLFHNIEVLITFSDQIELAP